MSFKKSKNNKIDFKFIQKKKYRLEIIQENITRNYNNLKIRYKIIYFIIFYFII